MLEHGGWSRFWSSIQPMWSVYYWIELTTSTSPCCCSWWCAADRRGCWSDNSVRISIAVLHWNINKVSFSSFSIFHHFTFVYLRIFISYDFLTYSFNHLSNMNNILISRNTIYLWSHSFVLYQSSFNLFIMPVTISLTGKRTCL